MHIIFPQHPRLPGQSDGDYAKSVWAQHDAYLASQRRITADIHAFAITNIVQTAAFLACALLGWFLLPHF
jgi:hypothetical protein